MNHLEELVLDHERFVWCITSLDREASDRLMPAFTDLGVEFMLIAGDSPGGRWPPRNTVALIAADEFQSSAIRSLHEARFEGPVVSWRRPGQNGYTILSASDQVKLGELRTIHVYDPSIDELIATVATLLQADIQVIEVPAPRERLVVTLEDDWNERADKFLRDSEELLRMSPRAFERFMADLLEREGYSIKLTKATRDGGVDIIAWKENFLSEGLFYVECKRNAPENKVGIGVVRSLYGVISGGANEPTGAVLVTTSSFTQPAIDFARVRSHRIALRDGDALLDVVRKLRDG